MPDIYPKISQNGCTFRVWAPEKGKMILHIVSPFDKEFEMTKDDEGYFFLAMEGIRNGCRYFYKPEGKKDYPDPASHFQPEGVHGPSEIVDHNLFNWTDHNWKGIPLRELVLYELHVGTFTDDGSFGAIIPRLPEIQASGINAIEIMPVGQFPGTRNWGYDGAYPYAVQNSYGGPYGLKELVNACHHNGIAVILDVVYNHLGPEGNYFQNFGPYFTGKYHVPWGDAINYDGEWSDGVREYYSNNPLYWYKNFHIDGIRVDAIHTMYDSGADHFWQLTYRKIRHEEQKNGRKFLMIAESDLNSPKVVRHPDLGGYGFDAVWLDDFHHALYVLLDKEGKSRYEDFGRLNQLAKAYKDGFRAFR
jgi:maltooligosyltrehalose trehalohydrolase